MTRTTRCIGKSSIIIALGVLLQGMVVPVGAAITYIDAAEGVSGNTYATGGSLADTTWVGPDALGLNDMEWNKRLGVEGNGSTVYQGSTTTNMLPELTTEIAGLADGTYTIWAFYWDQVDSVSQNWVLSAGLTSGALTTYSSPGEPTVAGATTAEVTNATNLSFTASVQTEAGWSGSIYLRNLFGVNLGAVTVSNGATVNVYIDNNLHTGAGNRTWYDGVGYERMPVTTSVTYVDAVPGGSGNTYATGGVLADTSWLVTKNDSTADEDQWDERDGFGNGGQCYQALHTILPDDMPELTTEIAGLADGTYDIWAFYWDQVASSTQNWVLDAGLISGNLTLYSSPGQPAVPGATILNVYNSSALTFTSSVLIEQATGNQNLFGIYLGEVTVTGGATVNVYIDNSAGNGSLNRSWYDGVGYSVVSLNSSGPGALIYGK